MSLDDPLAILAVLTALALGGLVKGATGAGAPLVAVPVMAAFFDVRVAVAVMVTVWLFAQGGILAFWGAEAAAINFPAEPWSNREWFFNPFGWQLLFFTGFALMRGWIPAPPVKTWLIVLALIAALAKSMGLLAAGGILGLIGMLVLLAGWIVHGIGLITGAGKMAS